MLLPHGVLAFRVIRNANIPKEDERVIRTTIKELTYKEMCKQCMEMIILQS